MAPSPVFHEPKGPDKGSEKDPEDHSQRDKQIMSHDNIESNSKDESDEVSTNLENLEDGALKLLLDEAFNYRGSDREGKSRLFQKYLNEVEESDQNLGLIDSSEATSTAIESSHHDTVGGDQTFLNNILGGCEREKKTKKKNGKRDSSNSNGGSSRRPKFSHSLKINSGSQSSVYNGSIGSSSNSTNVSASNISTNNNNNNNNNHCTNLYNSNSRGLPRASLSVRGSNASSKSATLLTSSSNIDRSTVTTYNREPTQCIMTPAVAPRKHQNTELMLLQTAKASSSGDESVKNEEIELKPLSEVRGSHYTTRASLEIDDNVSEQQHSDTKDEDDGYSLPMEDGLVSGSAKSSNILMNGNGEMSPLHPNRYFNGTLDNRGEDITSEIDEEKQQMSLMRNKMKSESSSTDVVAANGTSSVDEAKSTFAPQKNVQNFWTTIGYPLTNVPFLILNNLDTTGNYLQSGKESLEPRRSGDEGTNYQHRDGNGATSRLKKKKVKKPDGNSYLSEHIAGHCGDKSLEYLLNYIEKNRSSSGNSYAAHSHSINGTVSNQKSPRVKQPMSNGGGLKLEKMARGKASTDEDVRAKKSVACTVTASKAKEHLKKSTSLEDLRHSGSSRSKSNNKKQSSVDDCHYGEEAKANSPPSPVPAVSLQRRPSETKVDAAAAESSRAPTAMTTMTTTTTTTTTATATVDKAAVETRLGYDSPFDDSYTDEFHLVTKKQRRKKRRSTSRATDQKCTMILAEGRTSVSHGGFLPHNYTDRGHDGGGGGGGGFKRSTRSTENRHRSRRKSVSSVVPSDKISDSDSIHSLPVSSTTPKCRIKKKSTSSGCTPQASYADIAKSPQCQSSMTLNGDSTTAAKWQTTTKTLSNISSSSFSSTATNAARSTSGSAHTSNTTVNSPDHSDRMELVSSSTKYEDPVELDDGCDQLLLSKNHSSDTCSGFDSPTASVNNNRNNVYENENLNNELSCSNLNDSNNSNNNINNNNDNASNNINRIGVTLKSKNKSIKSTADNADNIDNHSNYNSAVVSNVSTIVNSYSQVCFSGKLEKSKDCLNPSTDTNADDINSNYNHDNSSSSNNNNNNNVLTPSKAKKSKSKKKTLATEQDLELTAAGDDNDKSVDQNSNDLFIEVTLAAPSVKTRCSQTQTDRVEVNNNACDNDVTIEETVIVKSHRNIGSSATEEKDSSKSNVRKLPTATENVNTDSRIFLLPSSSSGSENRNTITVGFNVDGDVLEEESAVRGGVRRAEQLREIAERGSMYNVDEVVQFIRESWKDVRKSSPSATKVQYYNAE